MDYIQNLKKTYNSPYKEKLEEVPTKGKINNIFLFIFLFLCIAMIMFHKLSL